MDWDIVVKALIIIVGIIIYQSDKNLGAFFLLIGLIAILLKK